MRDGPVVSLCTQHTIRLCAMKEAVDVFFSLKKEAAAGADHIHRKFGAMGSVRWKLLALDLLTGGDCPARKCFIRCALERKFAVRGAEALIMVIGL
jgi:hypothetical protein